MTDLFGQIKIAGDLEQAAINTLQGWWPVYARELELQHSLTQDILPLPKSYLTADRVDREAADQLPSVVVVSPGLSGTKPQREGDGTYRVYFSLAVGTFVSARDRKSTKDLLRMYVGIARTIMIQQASLGGFVSASDWVDESYDDVFDFVDGQTIGAGQVIFEVMVDQVVNKWGGPQGSPQPVPDPVTQPGSNWPLVQTVTPTVTIKED